MANDIYTEVLGDLFVYDLQVDFILKKTTIIFGVHPEANLKPTHSLTFTDVIWQEFREFEDYNILFDIEVSNSFKEFSDREKDYLRRMEKYIPSDLLLAIKKDKNLKYYFIRATKGLGGFVICKDSIVNNI